MAEFTPILTGGDAFNITAQVAVTEPLGIRKLVYRDRFGIELGSEMFNCETTVVGNVGSITITRLPFIVELTTCTDIVIPSGPLFAYPTTGMPNPAVPLPCNPLFCPPNAPCDAAQSRVERARLRVNQLCPDFRLWKQRRDFKRDLMIYLYAAAAAIAIIGAINIAVGGYVGLIVGIIALVIAAILLGAAFAVTAEFNETNFEFLMRERQMNTAINDFNEAANDARNNCCPHCITVDLTPPTC